MPELILRSGKRSGRRIPLPEGEVIIGRDEEGCRIRLTSSDVSRHHCRLRCRADDGVIVTDLGSRNGTFINEIRINAPTSLAPGDLLRVGPFVFQTPGHKPPRNLESDITNWLMVEENVGNKPPAGAKNDTTLVPNIDEDPVTGENDQPTESEAPAQSTPETERENAANENDPVIQQISEIIQGYWDQKATIGR